MAGSYFIGVHGCNKRRIGCRLLPLCLQKGRVQDVREVDESEEGVKGR